MAADVIQNVSWMQIRFEGCSYDLPEQIMTFRKSAIILGEGVLPSFVRFILLALFDHHFTQQLVLQDDIRRFFQC
jgi:hypothetical protein